MGVRGGLLVLLVLTISWLNNVDARNLVTSNALANQVNYKGSKNDTRISQEGSKGDNVCTLCEQYTSQAIDYLRENKTQKEIIGILHVACSQTRSFRKECTTMVDYYLPLFFMEIAKVEPEELCSKINFCDSMAFVSQDSCALCHEAVAEILNKLQDPDTQLEIIEILLKACEKAEQYAKKCKRLVFQYGPLILANAEKYLVKNDVCAIIHACLPSTDGIEEAASSISKTLLAES